MEGKSPISRSAAVLAELKAREPIFHHPELGTTRQDFERMMAEDFWEVGASGRTYSRQYVLNTLENRPAQPEEGARVMSDFQCREISAITYLVTYTLAQGIRITRRSTLWRRGEEGWQALYHQGTLVES